MIFLHPSYEVKGSVFQEPNPHRQQKRLVGSDMSPPLSKSISYSVSANGTSIGVHIFVEAADAGSGKDDAVATTAAVLALSVTNVRRLFAICTSEDD
mmetsp:Transcript_37176/g.86687  ORF Transcript_37176/g.86687 Transcript_37176/m.86687 type:complete len:97 (-) Transcript_37176:210-500(-)